MPLTMKPLMHSRPAAKALLRAGPAAALFLLAGCASDGAFPSLARRPAEGIGESGSAASSTPGRIAGSAAPAAPAPDVATAQQAVSADLPARLAELGASARAASERFTGKRARAEQLVSAARGAAPGTEAWSVATIAMADLESARSDVMVSLGELDRLYAAARIDAAAKNAGPEQVDGGDGGAIAAVRDQVTAWVADEDAVLADLGGRLAG